jgi:FAD dependent oxidoreductase
MAGKSPVVASDEQRAGLLALADSRDSRRGGPGARGAFDAGRLDQLQDRAGVWRARRYGSPVAQRLHRRRCRSAEGPHAGIYYPTGLTKTRLCVEGKAMLYAFAREFGVPHKRCGKLLVAVNEGEVGKLAALKAQAEANGVTDLVWLSGAEARALEPALVAECALLSPSTGIIDAHAFMVALRGEAEAHGATIAFETPVIAGSAAGRGLMIETGGAAPMRIAAAHVVNAAGLGT